MILILRHDVLCILRTAVLESFLGLYLVQEHFDNDIRTSVCRQLAGLAADCKLDVAGAGLVRSRACGKVFAADAFVAFVLIAEAFHGELTALGADRGAGDARRTVEFDAFLALLEHMDVVHDVSPQVSVVHGVGLLETFVKSGPDGRRVVLGEACKPEVVVVVGRTGLAGYVDLDLLKTARGTGTDFRRINHGVREKPCGCRLHYLTGLGDVLQQNIVFVVKNLRVVDGLVVFAAVGDCSVGCGHLQNGDTVGQTSEGDGNVVIGLSVALVRVNL